ncbi:MAG: DNA alkylation repair protein [Spirochaetes bacterium]|nr:DNA alkylation repair protein [Spirochaetota bacterium]
MMAEFKKLKFYFDNDLALLLAKKIKQQDSNFADQDFIKNVTAQIEDLELKARVNVFTDFLYQYLPSHYPAALGLLLNILGPENESEKGMFTQGYWLMPVAFFVEKYGLPYYDESVQAIYEITKRHTGEYTVRPFLEQYPEKMLAKMLDWSTDSSFHVRRLASEGVRPRLPWAKKLDQFIEKPQTVLPILENLKEDSSKFVQKSVANCINDILKDNYQVGMDIAMKWSATNNLNTKWIIKHALRKELKKGNPQAIQIVNQ